MLSHSLLFSFFFHYTLLLFHFFFAVFLGNLHLKSVLHFLLLGFTLVLDNILFITADENVTAPLELHVHPIFCDSTAYFEVGEVIFGLHRGVLRISQSCISGVVLCELWWLILKVLLCVLVEGLLIRHASIVLCSHA